MAEYIERNSCKTCDKCKQIYIDGKPTVYGYCQHKEDKLIVLYDICEEYTPA